MNIALKTLGCKLNQAEEQELIRNLLLSGYNITTHAPDIFIVNTCCVTKEAQHKSRKLIRKIIRENNSARVIVTGCYANLNDDKLNKINGIYKIVPNEEKNKIIEIVNKEAKNKKQELSTPYLLPLTPSSLPLVPHPFLLTPYPSKTRAFLKIQDGCNRFCSYCIVPYVRNKIYSKPIDEIVGETRYLVDNNYKEIVLTAACIGLYEYNLIKLLDKLEKINSLKRIRLTSIDPTDVSDELIDYIATSEKVCPHLHIPLQSGDDKILKLMNRNYTTTYYKSLVDKIKTKIKEIAITTDIMVGFPGESDQNFNNTIKLIEYVEFAKCHIFKYSKLEQTNAASINNQVDELTKQRRSEILINLSKKYSAEFYKKYINQILDVLIEEDRDNTLSGYTKNYIKVFINNNNNNELISTIAKVKIDRITPTYCEGILISTP